MLPAAPKRAAGFPLKLGFAPKQTDNAFACLLLTQSGSWHGWCHSCDGNGASNKLPSERIGDSDKQEGLKYVDGNGCNGVPRDGLVTDRASDVATAFGVARGDPQRALREGESGKGAGLLHRRGCG